MNGIVDLAERRFERDAAPGVDACISLIEECVLAGVTDPINASFAIFIGTVLYLLSKGCPVELLRAELDRATEARAAR